MVCPKPSPFFVNPRVFLTIATVLVCSSIAQAAQFRSCGSVLLYLNDEMPTQDDMFARVEALDGAGRFIRGKPCEASLAERTLKERADAMSQYAKSFRDTEIKAYEQYTRKAADAYKDYFDWVLDAGMDKMSVVARTYGPNRRDILRRRGGNALMGYADALVRLGRKKEIPTAFERVAEMSVEFFSTEVIEEWNRWLRAHPSKALNRTDAEIARALRQDTDERRHWELFATALKEFCRLNPRAAAPWERAEAKIRSWLN